MRFCATPGANGCAGVHLLCKGGNMLKRIVVFSFAAVLAVSLSGCVTFGKKKDLEIQGLKNQVTALESQLQNKDQKISGLREELDRAAQERNNFSQNKGIFEAKSRPNNKQIQLALRNAGYNPGKIDGRIGRQTREAIKAFQRANNIPVDGKVAKQTWEALRGCLVNKVK